MRLAFESRAFEDLAWWITQDRKKAGRIADLILETGRTPFTGRGKPEPLKGDLKGCWSRRIDAEHRLVYQITDQEILILACRFHYRR